MTAKEWRMVTQYKETVIGLHAINTEIETWTKRGYPVPDLIEHAQQMKKDILRSDEIIEQIQDRRARNVLRCRFVLGYSISETAEFMNISHGTVDLIIKKLKPSAPANE